MNFVLNNKKEEFNSELPTIDRWIKLKNLTFKMRVLKISGFSVNKNKYVIAKV